MKRPLLGLLAISLLAIPAVAMAKDWLIFQSPSGVYEARFPEGFKSSSARFLINDNRAVHAEETTAIVDQRPYKNTLKSYIIKFDQTFGPELNANNVSQLLSEEFRNYIDFYEPMGGVLVNQNMEGYNGHWGGEIQISYKDPEYGEQSLRARILYGNDTRLQQIVIGTKDLMDSYATRDFMQSLIFDPGVSIVKGLVREQWLTMESPTGMFTMLYPGEKAPPYFTAPPISNWDKKTEVVVAVYHDPVRNENVYFKVYGYQFDNDLDFAAVQEILTKRHINKYRQATKGIRFNKGISSGNEKKGMLKFPFMETTFPINPPKDHPYISTVRLRSFFSGKNLMVMETMTSDPLFASTLVDNLMGFVNFQPDKIHEATKPSTPVANVPAPLDTTPAPEFPSVPTKLKPGQKQAEPRAIPNLTPTAPPPDAPAKP
ncbi:MAG: hypothetical protein WBK55_05050 [Alphaproteobacteria bacterium]